MAHHHNCKNDIESLYFDHDTFPCVRVIPCFFCMIYCPRGPVVNFGATVSANLVKLRKYFHGDAHNVNSGGQRLWLHRFTTVKRVSNLQKKLHETNSVTCSFSATSQYQRQVSRNPVCLYCPFLWISWEMFCCVSYHQDFYYLLIDPSLCDVVVIEDCDWVHISSNCP